MNTFQTGLTAEGLLIWSWPETKTDTFETKLKLKMTFDINENDNTSLLNHLSFLILQ